LRFFQERCQRQGSFIFDEPGTALSREFYDDLDGFVQAALAE
jgi:predicted ATPase